MLLTKEERAKQKADKWKDLYIKVIKDLNDRLDNKDITEDEYLEKITFYNKMYEGRIKEHKRKVDKDYDYAECLDAFLAE